MILASGLLVLVGLGLFVGGVVTGLTALYWSCVVSCGLAAVLLVVARLRTSREAGESDRRGSAGRAGTGAPHARRTGRHAPGAGESTSAADPVARERELPREPAGATAVRTPEPEPEPAPSREDPHAGEPAAAGEPAGVAPSDPAAVGHPGEHSFVRRGAHEPREVSPDAATGEPGEEDVEVSELLLVVDLDDEVLVVDEHPRYHLAGCPFIDGREAVPLPMVEARTDGFSPCALCRPVRHLAETERSRRRAARGS